MLARHRRLRGDDVRFTVGSDEHSQSVERAARAAGMEPADFCTRQVDAFKAMMRAFDVEPTSFVRTSSDANRRTSETLWRAVAESGHIYKDWYRAWFCPSCEQFYTEKEIVAGLCPIHDSPVEWVEEQNWFFRLSAFESAAARPLRARARLRRAGSAPQRDAQRDPRRPHRHQHLARFLARGGSRCPVTSRR